MIQPKGDQHKEEQRDKREKTRLVSETQVEDQSKDETGLR